MSDMIVKTNGHARDLVAWYFLPAEARKEFEYVVPADADPENLPDDAWTTRFFRYRGSWYDSHEFERHDNAELRGWDAWQTGTPSNGTG